MKAFLIYIARRYASKKRNYLNEPSSNFFFVFYLLLFQQLNFAAMFLELALTTQICEIT